MSRTNYKKMIVVDVEATCWEPKPFGYESEVIEVGVAYLYMSDGEIVVENDIFIRPVEHGISDFCTKLTSITPEMVAHAPTMTEMVSTFAKKFKDCVWASWGEYDRTQFEREFRRKGLGNIPFGRTHVNLKSEFARYMGLERELGVEQALNHLGMAFLAPDGVSPGTAHRGSHDAYNIARIARAVMSGNYSKRWNDT